MFNVNKTRLPMTSLSFPLTHSVASHPKTIKMCDDQSKGRAWGQIKHLPGVECAESTWAEAGRPGHEAQEAALVPSVHGRENLQEVPDGRAAGGIPAKQDLYLLQSTIICPAFECACWFLSGAPKDNPFPSHHVKSQHKLPYYELTCWLSYFGHTLQP